jgi:hypothetical protein
VEVAMSMRVDRGGAALASVWFTLYLSGAASALMEAGADADSAALPGMVIEEADVPRAADARLLDEIGRGARARVPLPPAVERRLSALVDERARAAESTALGAEREALAPPPGDAEAPSRQAPSRMDAGDGDPDRLRTVPPLPGSR